MSDKSQAMNIGAKKGNSVSLRKLILPRIDQSTFWWRWISNFEPSFRYRQDRLNDGFDRQLHIDIATLKSEGIFVGHSDDIFNKTALLLLDEIMVAMEEKLQEDKVQDILRKHHSGSDRKDYVLRLLPKELDLAGPFIQLAIQPRLLDMVNGYLGMQSYLRDVNVWLNFPISEPAKETQLWHRDTDDHMNVKVFIYLNDVDETNGPFCFIPKTHRLGKLYKEQVCTDASGRVSDEEMASSIPPLKWKVCTGHAKTAILADTIGYHKGLKPERGYRLMLIFQYTSGKPKYPSSLVLHSSCDVKLTNTQKYALFAK
ncbi:MAG: phytanoyl-CoA dioxygenase family protein [Xenococcaceae cyanobacterium]